MLERINLLGLTVSEMEAVFEGLNEPLYRARQVVSWIHQFGVQDFDSMTNLSKSLRQRLSLMAHIAVPEVKQEQVSVDGTIKWLIQLSDHNAVEAVFIPEKRRGTLCVSSQVGCMLTCDFCSTGKQGFKRNLTVAEIIGQVWIAVRRLGEKASRSSKQVTNVVMMGMGEPLFNVDNVVKAMALMMDDHAYGLSKRRVTLSTAGVVPAMTGLFALSEVALAVSLHAPNNALRDRLVPLNKKYPLEVLIPVCRDYFKSEPRRRVTFEYVMLAGVNDSEQNARELVRLLSNVPCKVNLIPFNTFPHAAYCCSEPSAIERFRGILYAAGINTITRKTRGDDIAAACGQLVGEVHDRTKRALRWREMAAAQG